MMANRKQQKKCHRLFSDRVKANIHTMEKVANVIATEMNFFP